MVTDSRAPLGTGAGRMRPLTVHPRLGLDSRRQTTDLRPLNAPMPLRVQLDDQGRVVAIWRQGRLTPRTIAAIQDRWRIDDEWWREHPVSRMYYAVVLDDGSLLTMYQDLTAADRWFEQRS
jgi:hypothetical protein